MRTLNRLSTIVAAIACTGFVFVCPLAGQEAGKSTAMNRQIVKATLHFLERQHVSRHPFDDEISSRVFKSLFESLDPGKLYFLKSDIEEFRYLADRIDDLARNGDTSPGKLILDRMKIRSSEAIETIDELIKVGFDFSLSESVVIDRDKLSYAADRDELRDRWRRELKRRILVAEAQDAESRETADVPIIAPLKGTPTERVFRECQRRHRRLAEMSLDKVFEWYLNAIAVAYDPHTSYMSPNTMEEFMIHVRSNLQGIGAELREHGDYVYITRILDGGGAARCADIAKGDRILAVSQDGTNWVSAFQMASGDLANMIRGKAGSTVHLKLASESDDEKVAAIERSKVELKRQQATGHLVQFESPESDHPSEAKLKVGYVKLPGFYQDGEMRRRGDPMYRSCSRDIAVLLSKFREAKAQAVVLDLRGNGGGILDEAVRVTGLFIDRGPVVQIKSPGTRGMVYRDMDSGTAWDGPLVVLIDKYSASASEIVAGSLQDYGRAIVVGDTQTHGKGTVQEPIDLAEQLFRTQRSAWTMGSLKLTKQKYYLPNGLSTQQMGVKSEIVIPYSFSQLAEGEEDLPYAIPNDKTSAISHDQYEFAAVQLVNRLKSKSVIRGNASRKFKETQTKIEEVKRQRERDEIPVQREAFSKYWQRFSDNAPPKDETLRRDEAEPPQFPANEYDNEVLHIARDYVEGLNALSNAG